MVSKIGKSTAEDGYSSIASSDRTGIYSTRLDAFRSESRCRVIPASLPPDTIDMTSNDYLGLASSTGQFSFSQSEMTSSASRLLCGRQEAYSELEQWLADQYGRPALIFNSGYHANTGCIAALAIDNVTIIADRLVHASIIDGIRLSGAKFKRFRHNDVAACERMVSDVEQSGARALVVTESVFSMDGDVAPLRELTEMRDRHKSMLLYVDEAHAFGVMGERGLGLSERLHLTDRIDIIAGTFGKAAASMGAFIVADGVIRDYLLNTARSFIFSTVLPPACVSHTLQMVRRMSAMGHERERLANLSARFREGIEAITGTPNPSRSQIVPLLIGDARLAMSIAAGLADAGIRALPIRRPTVPPGTERIRFALSSRLSSDDIDRVLDEIASLMRTVSESIN